MIEKQQKAFLAAVDTLPPLMGPRGLLAAVFLLAVRDWLGDDPAARADAAAFFRSDWCRYILDVTGLPLDLVAAAGGPVLDGGPELARSRSL